MDYRQYMELVKKQLEKLNEQEKTNWLYEYARTLNATHRYEFMESIGIYPKEDINYDSEEMLEWCEQIELGELFFDVEIEDCYNSYNYESDYENIYLDPSNIINTLDKAFNLCKKMINNKQYQKAETLLKRLLELNFQYMSLECGDCGELSLKELNSESLFLIDYKKIYLQLIYCCYQVEEMPEKMNKIMTLFSSTDCPEILMSDIMAFGPEELTNLQTFMEQWHQFLKTVQGKKASLLLEEASIYLGKEAKLLETAREVYLLHPYLIKAYLERIACYKNSEESIKIAQEAITNIPKNRVIRAEIANLAIEQFEIGYDRHHFLYEAAFISQPTSFHLFRLYMLEDYHNFNNLSEQFMAMCYPSYLDNNSQGEATLDETKKDLYRFLLGDYNYGLNLAKQDNRFLGWSYNFKGTFILLVLMLLRNNNCSYLKSDKNLLSKFENSLSFETNNKLTFEELFNQWRSKYNYITDKDELISWLMEQVDQRANAVIGGGYRHSYNKVADLIVVLGKILEEQGKVDNMIDFVKGYKKVFSQKRAFIREVNERINNL